MHLARLPTPLAFALALAASGCSDTLVDHEGKQFYAQPCAQQGNHFCDRGSGPICEPVGATSCGDGLACTDCTVGFSVPNATPNCQAAGTCGYQCNAGWLHCDAGCCRAIAVAAGARHTCAIVGQATATSGQLKCWGANDRGQLGVGDTQDRLVPADIVSMRSGVTLVAAGAAHTCAVKDGAFYCWGANGDPGFVDGRLGVTTSLYEYDYPETVSLAGVTAIAPGERHTCALASGGVYCWGANDRGQLGSGTLGNPPRLTPPATPTLPSASAVVSGRAHTCALVAGAVRCWGANDWGQLGNAEAVPGLPQPSPVAVGTLPPVTALAAGAHHSCAIDTTTPDPLLWCWGENTDGQLGRGTVGGAFSSPGIASDVQSLRPAMAVGGRAHTCGLRLNAVDGIKCFGSNATGQLGGPGPTANKIDVQIGQEATALAAGGDHACALIADGSLFCWGANDRGQVGDGSTSAAGVFLPTLVSGR